MGKYLEDMKTREYQCLVLFFLSSTLLSFTPLEEQLTNTLFDNFLEPVKDLHRKDSIPLYAKFSLRKASDPEDDVCFVYTGKPESLHDCNFNVTSKTFLVIHGWTVSGMFESWVAKLVTALHEREQNANVIVVDWLSTAQNHYTVAARNTKVVGQYIAQFINWMEATTNFPLENLHLIGYSLGAHVAGFAGSHASNKVGRITGLDPAGPDFEGARAHRRLSPDDAHFVDVLHTFSRGSLGLSIGIQQPVGHVDIYPNGGGFQPGCNLRGALEKIANHGIVAMSDAVKCEHERSVHLFIDSLLNEQEAGQAYSCGSDSMFDRGVCLSCQKNRCNAIGYGASKVRRARSARMFTKTRASMPYRVYHYQLKIHFLCKANRSELEPTLTVSLYGTKGDAEDIQLSIKEKISSNKTHSFLLVTEKDMGELLMMKLKWEDSSSWSYSSLLKTVSDWWSGAAAASSRMEVHKIRIKVGETQESVVLCLKNPQLLGTSQEVMFVKCKDEGKSSSKSHTMKKQ